MVRMFRLGGASKDALRYAAVYQCPACQRCLDEDPEGDQLAAHNLAEDGGPYQKRLAMRQAARMAWIRLDNSSRLRRAMLAQKRAEPGPWLPGEQVYSNAPRIPPDQPQIAGLQLEV